MDFARRPVRRLRRVRHPHRVRGRGVLQPARHRRPGPAPPAPLSPSAARRRDDRGAARCDNARMTAPDDSGTTHFGFREVPVAEKRRLVGQVFSSVAGNYDLMNDLMSLGIHRVWKRYFVATAQVPRGGRVLDLAGGTGDIAALLRGRLGPEGEVVLGDINAQMLRTGRDRMTDRGSVRGLHY